MAISTIFDSNTQPSSDVNSWQGWAYRYKQPSGEAVVGGDNTYGTDIFNTLTQNKATQEQRLYSDVAYGKVNLSPTEFDKLLSSENGLISRTEFNALPTSVQEQARANPQLFLQSVMQNQENTQTQDLLSLGAQGGYNTFKNVGWDPKTGLQFNKGDYSQVDQGIDPGLVIMSLMGAGLGALAFAPAAAAAGSGAAAMEGSGAAAMEGSGAAMSQAEMLAAQEAGFSTADLAGWGGATPAGAVEGASSSQLTQLASQYNGLGYNSLEANALAAADIGSTSGAAGSSLAVQGGALDTLGTLNTGRKWMNVANQLSGGSQQAIGQTSRGVDPVTLALRYLLPQFGQQDMVSKQLESSQKYVDMLKGYIE